MCITLWFNTYSITNILNYFLNIHVPLASTQLCTLSFRGNTGNVIQLYSRVNKGLGFVVRDTSLWLSLGESEGERAGLQIN